MIDQQALARVGQLIGGKYRLERLLGAGGMGAVYAAQHEFTKRRVAVKLMHEAFAKSDTFAQRFIREAQAPSAIGHAGIVDVLDGGIDEGGALYLVLEMLQGKTLGDLETPLNVPDLCDVVIQLLDALSAAHKAGFVHRDIKPDNVFLTHDASGQRKVKLLDFGVAGLRADLQDKHLTQTGTILGTPTFMSPEQAKGDRVDQRSDLWAVGAILYDALAGHPPYDAETYNAVIVSIVTREHVPLERVRPDLPRRLLEVIELSLRKDPAHRWQSAAEMATALRAIPNLEALSGVVTKHAPANAVAATAVARARPRATPKPSIEAPHLTRPTVDDKPITLPEPIASGVVAPAQATPASAEIHAARQVTTLAEPTAPPPASGVRLWVGASAAVIALAIAVVVIAHQRRAAPSQAASATRVDTPVASAVVMNAAPAPAQPAAAANDTPADPATPAAAAPSARTDHAPRTDNAPPSVAPNTAPADAPRPLTHEDLSAVLAQGQGKLQRCYQEQLSATLMAGGTAPPAMSLNVTLQVMPSGEVRDSTIEGEAPDALRTCVRTQLRAFRFRPSNEATELNFPVVFQPTVITR